MRAEVVPGGLMVSGHGEFAYLAPGTRYESTVEVGGAARLDALAVITMRRREPENLQHIENTLEARAGGGPRG